MNEMLLNKARLNVVSLNKAQINGDVERHGSSAGGGGEVIPPEVPVRAEFAIDSETMTLHAEGSEDDKELSSLSFSIDASSMNLIMNGGGIDYNFMIDSMGNLIVL